MSRFVQITIAPPLAFAALLLAFVVALPAVAGAAEAPPELWKQGENCGDIAKIILGECGFELHGSHIETIEPRGIGVDPNLPGHLYVADQNNDRVVELTAWGQFVKAWGWGVRDGSPELQTCGPDASPPIETCQNGISGSGVGQFSLTKGGIAVDAAGDVYVGDLENNRVEKFDAAGKFLLMFGGEVDKGPNHPGNVCTAAYIAEGDTCGAGIEGAGNGQFSTTNEIDGYGSYIVAGPGNVIYVADRERIQEFDPQGGYLKSLVMPGEAQSLAVDPSSDLYVGFGSDNVQKLSPAGTTLCTAEAGNPTTALAVDSAGDLYVVADPPVFGNMSVEPRVLEFDSGCARNQVPTFGENELNGPYGGASTGIAVGSPCLSAGHDLYVTDLNERNSFIAAYGPLPDPLLCPPPEVSPSIDSQYATSVGSEDAVLHAQINPHYWSGTLGETDYYVQYGTAACLEGGWEAICIRSQPTPPGSKLLGAAANEDLTTSGVFLSGLQPDSAYRYRFVADSHFGRRGASGPIYGIDPDGEGPEEASSEAGLGGEFTTPPPSLVPEQSCANHAFRAGASTRLPDCRAYELVSPLQKGNGDIVAGFSTDEGYPARHDQSAASGERITYSTARAFGDAESSPYTSQYIAARGGEGWSSNGISPPRQGEALSARLKVEREYVAFTADLSIGWLEYGFDPPLTSNAPTGFPDLYQRNNDTGGYGALSEVAPAALAAESYYPEVQGFSTDGNCSVFRADGALTGDASSAVEEFGRPVQEVYENCGTGLRLLSVLPGGAACDQEASAGSAVSQSAVGRSNDLIGAVSGDAARVFFSCGGRLYLRENAMASQSASGECDEADRACTTEVSPGAAQFWAGDTVGVRAIFTSGTLSGGEAKLFEFDAETEAVKLIAAKVYGVMGASENALRVYFVTGETLGGKGKVGQPNLFLNEEGTLTFVATLSNIDASAVAQLSPIAVVPVSRLSRVSPDGRHIAFMSNSGELAEQVDAFDNTDANSGEADAELYVYEAGGELHCVSCDRTGTRPSGRDLTREEGTSYLNRAYPYWTAAEIPPSDDELYVSRALSSDGSRLFFDSFEALVSRDTDGTEDVYEWEEAANQKECEEKGAESYVAKAGGCISLISSGESPSNSSFVDASADGRDAFFATESSLTPQDPGLVDIYDARAGGGFPPAPVQPAACEGEACQSPPAAPNDPTPASASFGGQGNLMSRLVTSLVAKKTPVVKEKTARHMQAHRLSRALKACKAKVRARRKGCEIAARKRYGPESKNKSKKTKNANRGGKLL